MTAAQWISMEVLDVHRETPFMISLKLTPAAEDSRFNFQAGQHAKILCSDSRQSQFAMASEPEEKRFVEFLIKDHAGSSAHELCRAEAGGRLKVSPPFGKGYPIAQFQKKDVLLIGVGSGLSPLRSLLKSMLRREHQFGKITLLYGARTPEEIPYRSDFDLWRKKIDLQICLSRAHDLEWAGFKGRVTQFLPALSIHSEKTVACVCGTKAMQEEVTNLLERAGVSKENVLLNY